MMPNIPVYTMDFRFIRLKIVYLGLSNFLPFCGVSGRDGYFIFFTFYFPLKMG